MDILSYLTTLIKTHKEVGIPGLGTIYKRKSPGRYDIDTHSFLPPSYTLSFTSDLREQTLLTDLISKKKNISTDAATYFVEQFSQNILDELSGHQESDFGELGSFSTTSGSLTFIPKQDSNFGFDFYGLPTVKDELNSGHTGIIKEEASQSAQPVEEELPVVEKEHVEEEQPVEQDESVEETLPHVSEEQLELENNNADLGDGSIEETTEHLNEQPAEELLHLDSTEVPATDQKDNSDEQQVYEEIAEVVSIPQIPATPVAPVIETPEPLNDVYESANIFNKTSSEQAPPHFTLDYSNPEKTGMPAYMKVIIGLAAIIILAGGIYMAKPELFDGIFKKTSVTPVEIADTTQAIKSAEQLKLDSLAQADSIRKSNELAILAADSAKDSSATVKPVEKTTAAIEEKSKEATISYEIIAASLLNQKEADNFLADMKKKGIPAKVANMPGRRVKISIGSFTDEETAKKELEILKKTTKIPGIYIYPVRHTNNPK